ncbi:MAG: hypothetical protein ACLFTT_14005 [Candidatus Hydrogenedentota bacterium]
MGSRIDNSRASIAALAAAARRPGEMTARQRRLETARLITRTPEPEPARAGFGDNTINLAGASLNTLGRNLASSRDTVPTPEEVRAETIERIRSERERIAEIEEGRPRIDATRPEEGTRPDATPPEPRDAVDEVASPRDATRTRSESPSDARNLEPLRPDETANPGIQAPGARFDVSI